MRQNLLWGVAVLAAALCSGAVTPERIAEIERALPERPAAAGARVTERAAWEALATSRRGKSRILAAEALLTDDPVPIPPDAEYLEFTQNGNRSHYERSLSRLLGGFDQLCEAECLEGKGRFIPRLVAYVDAICSLKSWTLPAHDGNLSCFKGDPHVDLMAGSIALKLSFGFDWLGDRLPEATRAKIRSEVERRVFKPHLDHARGVRSVYCHWWFHGENNWNSVCNCCVVRAALALVEDRHLRAEFVAIAEDTAPYALRGYTDDGYCSEGMGYWNYGFGHFLMMGLALRDATGGVVDLFANPKMKKVMMYAYGYQIQSGRSPNFADGGGNPSVRLYALGRRVWPDLANSAALSVPLLDGTADVFSLRAFGQEPAVSNPTLDVLPPRTWFPDAQVLLSRAHHPDRTMHFGVAIKGGHNNELHNHNDVGSYVVMLDSCEMCGDPGGEQYTRRTFSGERYVSKVLNSYGHPVPVVGGKLQSLGRKAAAKVLETKFTEDEDRLVLEYAAAYNVKALKSLVRTMTFNRVTDTIAISDRIVCSEPTTFEVPVITYRKWTKNADASSFVISKEKGVRTMSMDVKASVPVKFSVDEIENAPKPSVQRLAFTCVEPVTEATITTTFKSR